LPGSGKSTLAMALERRLFDLGWQVYTLDGDNVRRGLSADLGFSPHDSRREHPPHRRGGHAVRGRWNGVHRRVHFAVSCGPRPRPPGGRGSAVLRGLCQIAARDVRAARSEGHYARARAGDIKNFTGVDAPYEPPEHPGIVIDTETQDIETCVAQLLDFVVAGCKT
jgi:bifunctional enzyme CysN/CysC